MVDATTAWIFCNGEIKELAKLKKMIQPGDRLFAADGGIYHLEAMDLWPERVIGDMDSIRGEDLDRFEQKGIAIERFPAEKDETDLELTLRRVATEGCRRIRIAGGAGGRLDQTLGNLFLLSNPRWRGIDVRLEDGKEEVFLIIQQGEVGGQPGDVVSLLPLGQAVRGVVTDGLRYPLRRETLFSDQSRGISNVMIASKAIITIEEGLLICIHTRQV